MSDELDEWDEPTLMDGDVLTEEPNSEHDDVPTVVRCRECGGPIEIIENWRPPEDAAAAWRWAVECSFACIVTRDGADLRWSFCPRTGQGWVGGMRVDFERRKSGAVTWDGVEKRRWPAQA